MSKTLLGFGAFFKDAFSAEKWRWWLRVLSHPADSFYEIRHREKGSPALAILVIAVFGVVYSMNRIFASFVVNDVDARTVDGVQELLSVLMLAMLFAVGNWAVTCLMNGEGRFKDIVTVVGYALTPLVLTFVPATIISQFLAAGEEVFYTFIMGAGVAWTAILLLVGVMTAHNYTLVKTLVTLVLTLLAMFAIIFFALLLADMINQVIMFFRSLYTEMIFRI